MSNIVCIFKMSDSSNSAVEAKTVQNIYLLEQEGEYPKTVIRMNSSEYNDLKSFEFCDITRDKQLFFKGRICSLTLMGEIMEIELTSDIKGDFCPEKIRRESVDIVEKFKEANPELFAKISTEEFLRTGECVSAKIKAPESRPIEIDNKVVKNTLVFKKALDAPISEVNLSLKASWISKRQGMVPISTKIEKRFKMARINTITPKKLESSWPEFGDRIRFNGTKATKYMIASSRLRESSIRTFPSIVIDDSIPKLRIDKHIYENRLLISWDFDQYMNESVAVRILSGANMQRGRSKILNINLRNVQEYIENPSCTSFFRSENGMAILNAIVKSIGDFMALSWRNIEIWCELIEDATIANLSCKDWVKLQDKIYKVTKIEREISPGKNVIKIKARAFSAEIPANQSMQEIVLPKEETTILTPEDIVEDILVSNEADVQYEKLLNFISKLKAENKINKNNYKGLINGFLNENQTKIQIITRPLKTEHCEKRVVEPITVCFCNGGKK